MIPQTTELSQIQAAFIDKDNRIEELMRQINSAQSLLNSLKETTNSLVGNGKITIKTYAGSNVGDFTVNQKEDKTITLPQQATVNNGTLTIQKNGTSVGTFTANQSGNTTANITVPTKTSEITNDSNFVSDANYVHTDNNFTNADKAEIGKINNSLQFTYVVDSNQALAEWAEDSHSGTLRNDYTSVLIKKGTWTYSVTENTTKDYFIINLSATQTQTIIGEANSKLVLERKCSATGSLYQAFGLGYPNLTSKPYNYFMQNLNVEVTNTNTSTGSGYGIAFLRCFNLSNCIGTGITTTTQAYGFYNCNNLLNCEGYARSDGSSGANGIGFYNCKKVTRCRSKGESSGTGSGFAKCYNVFECEDQGSTTAAYNTSYFSPTANATYACANTLNGGWNTTS